MNRKPEIQADTIVPLIQAAVTGLLVGLLAYSVAYFLDWPLWLGAPVGGTVMLGMWLSLLDDRRPPLPEPAPEPVEEIVRHQVQFTVKAPNAAMTRFVELPEGVDGQTMRAVAKAVRLPGGAFSRPCLCRRQRILTQNQYHDLRRAWLKAGLLAELPGNRTELTAAGRAVLQSYE